MTIREEIEARERQTLSQLAVCSADSRGREKAVEPCPVRTDFQRDRDRILHCNAFRRLKHKTQVFLSPEGDHYRTRLTHTLEVSQLARTVARALRLNEDLTEAIALGHDLGHTPFGHAGERALAAVCPHGFVHAAQSVRVCQRLERDGEGLNLTWEVLDGIACHTGGAPAATLEGRVVRFADKIAYMNHDIEDAVRAGVLTEEDVPWELRYQLGRTKSQRITTFLMALIENSSEDIRMDPANQEAFLRLQAFLFEAVYTNPKAKGEEKKAQALVSQLYRHFLEHPEEMPAQYQRIAAESDLDRGVCDYIAGMTDRYAVGVYEQLFVPKSWSVGALG